MSQKHGFTGYLYFYGFSFFLSKNYICLDFYEYVSVHTLQLGIVCTRNAKEKFGFTFMTNV